jgi:hypothetical protein
MIFSQRRKLLKFAAIMPMATFLSPVSALTRSGFDELIQEIVQNEKLFIQIGKDLQGSTLQKSPEYLRQQLISDTGCLTSTCKMDIQESILARIKEDFKNDRVVNYQGWILSQTELNVCQLAFIS